MARNFELFETQKWIEQISDRWMLEIQAPPSEKTANLRLRLQKLGLITQLETVTITSIRIIIAAYMG